MVTAELEGPAVFAHLQDAARQARDEAAGLHEDLRRLNAEMDDVVAHRGDSLLALAKYYLPAVSSDYIEQTFAGVRDELRSVLARQQRRLAELSAEVEQIQIARRQLEDRLGAVTAQLNDKVVQRDGLEKKVAQDLAADEQFQQLSHQVLQTEQLLTQNEQRVDEIRREAAEKLPSYEQSRLFQYLYQRQYGTTTYRCRGLTKMLDRWVAGLIDFGRARRSYDFLRVTPETMAAEVARRQQEFAAQMQQLEAVKDQQSEAAGLTAVLREGERLGAERDELLGTLQREQERAASLQEERLDLERSQGAFYNEAVDRFKSFLDSTETSVLEQKATATPQVEDDHMVSEIGELNRSLDSIKSRIEALSHRYEQAQGRLAGVEYIVGRYQQMDYDSQRSYFEPGFDPAQHLDQFFNGEINRRALWRAFTRSHRFRPNWLETTAANTSDIIESDVGRLLLYALINVAGPHMRDAASRGMQRRDSAQPPSSPNSSQPRSGGGFTSGRGF